MNRLITTVLIGLVGINTIVQAQGTAGRPRLVVGIVVDQLRTDYLDDLRDPFGEKGFKRLMKQGVFMRDVDFRKTAGDAATATAVIYTGAWPSQNGLSAATRYDISTRRSVPILSDAGTLGNYTTEGYSPAGLRLSTIADEIAVDGIGLPAIYSISTDPQQAVVMSGHAGKGAAWIDDATGRWATTTYYPDFPQPFRTANQYNPLSKRIDTLVWKPSRALSVYPGIPPQKKYYPFSHTFPRSDRDSYRRFKTSAPANEMVAEMATECLKGLKLGSNGGGIDMLNIGLTAAPYKDVRDGDFRVELEDTYLRLDGVIGRLLDEIDRTAGLDNTVVYLTGTGYYNDATIDDARYRIPTGELRLKRVKSLLNSYLSAKYGNGDYVLGIHGTELYLDHSAIEGKRLDPAEIRRESRDFLVKMSGVETARTLDDILGSGSVETESLRLRVDPKNSGDIFLTVTPGWAVTDDLTYPGSTHPVRTGEILTPAFIMGADVPVTEIGTPVDASAIAPTVTSILHIRSPNGAVSRPLTLRH